MRATAKKAKASDPVKCRELPKGHSQRKAGYRWIVETRLGGVRSRKFFRHDESKERDAHMADIEERAESLAKGDRAIVSDASLLADAAAAFKKLEPYGKTLGEAVSFYVQHLEALAVRDATPLSDIVGRFLDAKEKEGVSDVHRADLKNRIARFEKKFGKTPIANIGRNDVADWLHALPLSPQSKVNFRRVLANLFSYAVEVAEIIQVNPVSSKMAKLPRARKVEILSAVDVAALLKASPADVLPAMVLMVFCGIRNAEMFRLDWRNVDWEDATIEVTAENAKREGHARHVTIPANALEWIRPMAKRRGRIAAFRDFDEYTRRLQDARTAAGWDVGEWPVNALRKTFISCHYESFGSIDNTAKEAGTSVGMIHTRYRKLVKKRDADRLWKILPPKGAGKVKPRAEAATAGPAKPGHAKVTWPAPDALQALLWKKPVVAIARELGVSDKAVEKHAKMRGLVKPPRGYWLKKRTEELQSESEIASISKQGRGIAQ